MDEEIGVRIGRRLRQLGQTQAWLADQADVSVAAVSKWVATGKVARGNIPAVARALGLTTDQLLGAQSMPGLEGAQVTALVTMDEMMLLNQYRQCSLDAQAMLRGATLEGARFNGKRKTAPG